METRKVDINGKVVEVKQGYDYVLDDNGRVVQFKPGANPAEVRAKAKAAGYPISEFKLNPGKDVTEQPGMMDKIKNAIRPVTDAIEPITQALQAHPQAQFVDKVGSGFVRGARDVIQGGMQIGADTLSGIGVISPETRDDLYRHVNQSQQNYEQQYGDSNLAKGGRFAGQFVATAPVASIPGANASLLPRIASNTAQGAIVGALQPVENQGDRAVNTLIGAGTGGVAPEILRFVGNIVSKPANWMAKPKPGGAGGMTGYDKASSLVDNQGLPVDLTPDAKSQLQQAGIIWDDLPDEARSKIIQDALSLPQGSALKPEELARKGVFETLPRPYQPTQAMITQNADDFTREQTIANTAGGGPLRERYNELPKVVTGSLDDMRVLTGGATDETVAGQAVVEGLSNVDKALKARVDAAYAAARSDPVIGDKVSIAGVRKFLKDNAPDFIGLKNDLGGAVQAKLKQFYGSGGVRPLSVGETEQFRKWLNGQLETNEPAQRRLVKGLIYSLDESVLRSGNSEVFKDARLAHAVRKMTVKEQAIVEDLLSMDTKVDRTVPYEKVVGKLVSRNTSNDSLRQVLKTLNKDEMGKQAVSDLKASVLQRIEGKATLKGKLEGGQQNITYGSFKGALDEIGDEKLKMMFGEDAKRLRQLQEALRLAQPTIGSTNPSGSGYRVIEFLRGMMTKVAGGAVGAVTGGPVGAPAGVMVANQATDAIAQMSNARAAKGAANNPTQMIEKSRTPSYRLGDLIAPSARIPSIWTLQELSEERRK